MVCKFRNFWSSSHCKLVLNNFMMYCRWKLVHIHNVPAEFNQNCFIIRHNCHTNSQSKCSGGTRRSCRIGFIFCTPSFLHILNVFTKFHQNLFIIGHSCHTNSRSMCSGGTRRSWVIGLIFCTNCFLPIHYVPTKFYQNQMTIRHSCHTNPRKFPIYVFGRYPKEWTDVAHLQYQPIPRQNTQSGEVWSKSVYICSSYRASKVYNSLQSTVYSLQSTGYHSLTMTPPKIDWFVFRNLQNG